MTDPLVEVTNPCGWELRVSGIVRSGLRCALEAGHDATVPHDLYAADAPPDLDGDRREQLADRIARLLCVQAAGDYGPLIEDEVIRRHIEVVAAVRAEEVLALVDPLLMLLADYEAESMGM